MADQTWVYNAIRKIDADFNRSSDTHLILLPVPSTPNIQLYFKDESIHPTGSLKHRLARSLFLYGLCNGWIKEGTTIVEASSGSTAVSEAYFARLLGLPFIAVMPKTTSVDKIKLIEFYGGACHLVDDPCMIHDESRRLTRETGGHFMDQFTYAERATDWRGNNNIAETIYRQLRDEPHPIPTWIIVGAGTGGTSATLGRHVRYQKLDTQICVVDPDNSAFYEAYTTGNQTVTRDGKGGIEGIGRPRVEASFVPTVIDKMIQVPDVASYAGIHFLAKVLGRKCGASTGTNFFGACILMSEMFARGESGSIVTLICDPGDRYLHTCYNNEWLKKKGMDVGPWVERYNQFFSSGRFDI